jgi:hypothetical protein
MGVMARPAKRSGIVKFALVNHRRSNGGGAIGLAAEYLFFLLAGSTKTSSKQLPHTSSNRTDLKNLRKPSICASPGFSPGLWTPPQWMSNRSAHASQQIKLNA